MVTMTAVAAALFSLPRAQEVSKLKRHYNHFMYQALLHCAKNSMNALKNRIQTKTLNGSKHATQKPFFEVRRAQMIATAA